MREPIRPSVWRRARRNTALSVRAVRMASSEYQGCPPRVVRGSARQARIASSVNQTVKLRRVGAATLLSSAPLRTGRADCSASGSSLGRCVSHPLVMPVMAPPVQEAQVPRLGPAALVARLGMVLVHQADVLVRVERDAARGASIALGSEEVLPPSGEGASLQSPPPPLVPVWSCVGVQGAAASPDLDVGGRSWC